MNSKKLKCDFCNKEFVREASFLNHCCEKKKRFLCRDDKEVKIGFLAYSKFYSYSMKSRKIITYSDFSNSKYYSQFVEFGKYLVGINAINHIGFIDFILRGNVKLKDWTNEAIYKKWIEELGKKESPDVSIERSFVLMQKWADDTGEEWTDFFRKVNPIIATSWASEGRISPWLLFTGYGNSLFERMTDEQLGIISKTIDPQYWSKKIAISKEEVKNIQEALKGTNL